MSGTDDASRPGPVTALERLGRLSLREHSMESVLQALADLVKEVMPGSPEASVSVVIDDQPSTVVFTGQLAMDCDESQYGHGYGPCLHAATTGELVEVPDAQAETRWRDYMRRSVEYGALGSLSVPLPISEGVAAALNIYVREVNAFDDDSRSLAVRFAPCAAVAAGNMYAYRAAQEIADGFQIALESRGVIDQAKGILMERYKLTADQAFQALARVSMQTNSKVRDVADRLVQTGEFRPPRFN